MVSLINGTPDELPWVVPPTLLPGETC